MPRKKKESQQEEIFEVEEPLIKEQPKKKRVIRKKVKEIKQKLEPEKDEKQIELEIEESLEDNKELEKEEKVQEEPPAKPPRKKRQMSEETRQRLKENLARGRLTALENRKRKKRLKEIANKDKKEQEDKIIEDDLKKRNRNKEINVENERLRQEIAELKKAREYKSVNSSESKPVSKKINSKPKQVESIAQAKVSPPPQPYQPPKPVIRSMLPGGLVLNL